MSWRHDAETFQLRGGPSSTPYATSAGHFRWEGHDTLGVLAQQLAALSRPNKHFSPEELAAAEWKQQPFKDW